MDIVWDVQNHELLLSLTDTQPVTRLDWVLRDIVSVRLYYATPNSSGTGYTAAAIPSGKAIKCSIKASSGLSGDPLAHQYTWSAMTDGNGNTCYDADIDLAAANLVAAVTGSTLDVLLEFCLQDADSRNYDSTQVDLRVKADVHRPDTDTPSATSLTPWYEFFNDADTGEECLRIKNTNGQTLAVFRPAGV